MSTPKVSVVVPCYNVEKYLHQCIDSIVNQTLKDIEIICVNDGSKDSTLDILKEYAEKDKRVKIIDKANGGYGESMNRGFDMATGEYIGIVESDDYAEPDMFEKLYTCAKEHQLDAVKSGFYFYWSKGGERNIPHPIASRITSKRTFCPTTDFKSKTEMVEFFNFKPSIWSAIYRKDFIRENNIRFNETPGASFQDTSFNFKVWALAQRARIMEECFLHYRQDNEASSVNNPGKVYCVCDEYAEIDRFLAEHPTIKAIIEPVMVRIKFDSYCWNYERLSEPLQAEFIKRFSEEFLKHMADGAIRKEYFEWYKWKRVHQIMEKPEKYHELFVKVKNGEITENDAEDEIWRRDRYTIGGKEVPAFVDKLIGALHCVKDHGFWYTIKLAVKKIYRRVKK